MNPLALLRHALSLWLLALLCLAWPAPARAQDDEGSDAAYEKDRATLYLRVDEKGGVRVELTLAVKPGDPGAVRLRLAEAVGLPLTFESDMEADARYGEDEEAAEGEALGNWWSARARSEGAFPREGLVSGGRIDIARLAEVLHPLGVRVLYVSASFEGKPKNLRVSGVQKIDIPAELEDLGRRDALVNIYSASLEIDGAVPPVEFSWGYRRADILRQLAPLFLFLVVPPLLTLRTRWSVARKPQAEPVEVWGRYFRFLNRLIYFSWLAWLPLSSLAALGELLSAVAGEGGGLAVQGLGLAFLFAPPLFVVWLCHLLSSGIYRRVGGVEWSPRAVVGRVVALNAVQVAPFFLVLLALDVLSVRRGLAGLLMLGAVVAWLMLSQLAARAYGAAAHEVTRGELRDRVFALAEKAGVKLRQIYVIPDGPAQLSNAFARGDNSVMLTASLLRHLSKREVDAVLAHELGHLKERHPQAVARMTIGTIFAANLVGWALASAAGLQRWSAAIFALSVLSASLVAHYLSRGNERHADSIGINLTGDPEAFVTGLARLSRLNLMPLDGGRWGDALDTHPATLGRLRDIAGFGGITPARFEELIAGVRAGEAVGDRYGAAEAAPDRAFSAAFKARWTGRVLWSMVVVLLLPPALAALLVEKSVEHRWLELWGWPFWASLAAGLLLSLALYHLFRNYASFWGYKKLTARLRMRLAPREQAGEQPYSVGLSPGGEERSYENYPFWDAGLLRLSGGRLFYAGEQTQFELRRGQVKDIYLGDAHPIWLRQKFLHVIWHDEAQGRGGTFQLLPLGEPTLLRCRRETARLHGRLREWLAQGTAEHAAPETHAAETAPSALPDLDAVTGQPMSERNGARAYLRAVFVLSWLSFLLSLGMRLTLAGMVYSLAVVVAVCTLDHLPKLWGRGARRPEHGGESGESAGAAARPYPRGSWAES